MAELLERLRQDYVEGRIEIDEFERRVGPILKGEPLPEDRNRPIRPDELRFGPGIAIPVQEWPPPMTGRDMERIRAASEIHKARQRGEPYAVPADEDDWGPDAERELARRSDPTETLGPPPREA